MKKIAQFAIFDVQNRYIIRFWMICLFIGVTTSLVFSQPITGVWRGHIESGKGMKKKSGTIEVKLVAVGENIAGTVYYISNGNNYIRYSLKGSFWGSGKSIYWQDYSIVDMKVGKTAGVQGYNETMKYFANYTNSDDKNGKLVGYCMLSEMPQMNFELKKMSESLFKDEWDAVIEGHSAGKNSKVALDSVWTIASEPVFSGKVFRR